MRKQTIIIAVVIVILFVSFIVKITTPKFILLLLLNVVLLTANFLVANPDVHPWSCRGVLMVFGRVCCAPSALTPCCVFVAKAWSGVLSFCHQQVQHFKKIILHSPALENKSGQIYETELAGISSTKKDPSPATSPTTTTTTNQHTDHQHTNTNTI